MEKDGLQYIVREAHREEWQDAIAVAWKTFKKYEAPDYTQEGIRNFLEFITDTTLYRMFLVGSYRLFVAVAEDKVIGMITLRSKNHISLLFVDGTYHYHGVGRALLQAVCDELKNEAGGMNRESVDHITVNASPYAVGFYHKTGFCDTGKAREKNGIIYTPMEKIL